MPTPPTISVIIPTHDRCDVLPRAIESVLAQTTPATEIVVVDDGSTDETLARIAEYPVRVITQANAGVSAARNRGIEASTGDYIALLDSDDAWMPEKLARQMAAFADQPDSRLCHTDEIWIRNGRRVNEMKKHAKGGGWLFERCVALCCISPSASVIRRDLFDVYGLFDESLPACEDYDLWLRVTAYEPVLFVADRLTIKHGGHKDQLSRRFWGMDRFRIQALAKILEDAELGATNRKIALDTIVRKLEILVAGARKRQNEDVIQRYSPQLVRWRDAREALTQGQP